MKFSAYRSIYRNANITVVESLAWSILSLEREKEQIKFNET